MLGQRQTEKTELKDLAFCGGLAAFDEPLYVGRPNIGDRHHLIRRIDEILDRGWLTNYGPCVQEFERRLAETVGVKHCIAVCNATAGLEIAIRGLDLQGEVIVPSLTFVATAHAVYWQRLTPVFCDIDPDTHTLDIAAAERAINSRTTAIIGVHLWGRPCQIDELADLARRHHLKLIFDAAHAFACSYKGRIIGNFGDVEVFSFHATKFLNSFEGGAITTNDDELAARIRLMTNFGFTDYDRVEELGTNAKMIEVAAAMGLTSLDSLDEVVGVNRRNYDVYLTELANTPGIRFVHYDDKERCNYQYVVIEFDQAETHLARDRMVEILWAENVIARRYFYPGCHRMEPYRTLFPDARRLLPVTERVAAKLISLPTGTAVTLEQIRIICLIITLAVRNGDLISSLSPQPREPRAMAT